ncbi:hypothetical protein O1M54_03305 [Streptomyces diastatochromogenes]|nr:hypothetical protein [Streptomyces diastatochromogenes]
MGRSAPRQRHHGARLGLKAERRLDVLPAGRRQRAGGRRRARGQDLDWLGAHVDGWFNYPRDLAAAARHLDGWRARTHALGTPKPYLTPMLLDLTEDPDAPRSPIRLGLRTGRKALVEHLHAMSELGVAHLSLSLRPGERPVAEVLHELADDVLPHFPTPTR